MWQPPLNRLLLLTAVLALGQAVQSAAAADRPPNLVLISADDLGYAELGCYGQQWIKTPRIDQLAREGMRFTQFYAGNNVCAPSRCCLMTGKHPGHASIRNNGKPPGMDELRERMGWEFPGQYPIPTNDVTMAEVLKQAGYATGAMGKWGLGHFGTSGDPNLQGFDLFYGFNCQAHAHNHYPRFLWRNREKEIQPGNDRTLYGQTYSQDRFIDVAKQFVREHKDQPFFLYLPFTIPHLSIQVPQQSLEQYLGVIPEEEYQHRGYLQHPHPRAGYAAMVSHMDAGVGEVVDLIDQLGLGENTLILFTSDNGPTYDRLGGSDSDFFNSSGPLKGRKGQMDEGGIRVPLVARWTGKTPPGSESDLIAAWWDFLPTACGLIETQPPSGIDGVSLLPTLTGQPEQQTEHAFLYWESPGYTGQQAVRMGKWKAVRKGLNNRKLEGPPPFALYDLEKDIAESRDVAGEHPEVIAQIERIAREQHTPHELWPISALDSQAAN